MENLNINPSFLNSYHILKNMKKCHASTGKSFRQIMKFLEAIQTQILWESNQLQVVWTIGVEPIVQNYQKLVFQIWFRGWDQSDTNAQGTQMKAGSRPTEKVCLVGQFLSLAIGLFPEYPWNMNVSVCFIL